MLNYNYDVHVESAYIIRIKGNENSEKYAKRCADSCDRVGMPWKYFDAVDGTSGELKNIPDNAALNMVKLMNETMTPGEVACFISHFLLWVKCAEQDKPIVILEHDAIMMKPYLIHPFMNIISYLGSIEQVRGDAGMKPWLPMPPHSHLTRNYRFICRAHAYSIDPMIARNLVSKVIKSGITTPLDIFIRIDEFGIVQEGFYAHDLPGETTIFGRSEKTSNKDIMKVAHKLETL